MDTSLFLDCELAPPTALPGAGEAASPVGFPALPLAIAPRGHWHAAGESATTAAATQLARAALPSAHHHATHRGGHGDPSGGGRGRASREGPEPGARCPRRCARARGNREPGQRRLLVCAPSHEPTRKVPAAGPSPPSWAWQAGPPERRGRDEEAGSCPSFLPSFEIKILCSGRSTGGGPGGCTVSRGAELSCGSGSAAHVCFRRGDPARRHWPATAAGADARGRAATSPALGALGGRRAEGVARSVAAARSQSGGRLRRRALGGRAFPPGGSECAARRRGGTPSPLEWPAPGDRLSWRLHPRFPAEPSGPAHPTPRGDRLRRCARRHGGRHGPRLLPCLSTSNFRATYERLKEGRRPRAREHPPGGARLRLRLSPPRLSLAPGSPPPPRP